MKLHILDCTLRDGAHLLEGKFGLENKQILVDSLVESRIDIIELGFLMGDESNINSTYYSRISDVEKELDNFHFIDFANVQLSLMIRPDKYDIGRITEGKNRISIIRLAFYYEHLNLVRDFTLLLNSLGYKVSLNPINTPSYSFSKLIELIEVVNLLKPYSFSIVDTIGMLDRDKLYRVMEIIDNYLDKEILLGFHLHQNRNNLDQLVQLILSYKYNRESIIIDSTVVGFGRNPGNLQTEVLLDRMIRNGYQYNLEPLYKSINAVIIPYINEGIRWGYDPLYYLTGVYGIDRNYAEFFIQSTKNYHLSYKLIQELVHSEFKGKFDLELAEKLIKHVK
jgi:4-hydroxy 2-oxovalerate aldolase